MEFAKGLEKVVESNKEVLGVLVLEESGLCVGACGSMKASHAINAYEVISKLSELSMLLLETIEEKEGDESSVDEEEADEIEELPTLVVETANSTRFVLSSVDSLYVVFHRTDKATKTQLDDETVDVD